MSGEPKRRRRWRRIGWALLAALVLYPLSTGPAYLWASHSKDPATSANLLDTVYAPITWICERCQWAQITMDRYCDLW